MLYVKRDGKTMCAAGELPAGAPRYDVIVAGLGAAGAIALIAAARLGLSALGIERGAAMGGMATEGAVNGYYFGERGGLYEELDEAAERLRVGCFLPTGPFHPDAKKIVLQRAAEVAGGHVLLQAVPTGVYADGSAVRGIAYAKDGEMHAAGCRVLIDATGDADVADMLGCASAYGRAADGAVLPFTLAQVSLARDGRGAAVRQRTNTDCGYVDQRDAAGYTAALLQAQSNILHGRGKGAPGNGLEARQSASFLYIAPLPGLREGRTVQGEDTLTLERLLLSPPPGDTLFFATSDLDKHGCDYALESELFQDWAVAANLSAHNVRIPITPGMHVPKGWDGLLVSGRSLCMDHEVGSAVRMLRDMQKSGEAVAHMADLSIRHGVPLRDVPHQELAARLRATGCASEGGPEGLLHPVNAYIHGPAAWLTSLADIQAALRTDRPGVAIWSARLLGAEAGEALRGLLREGDTACARHAALALGLRGDAAALPLLRVMARERDTCVMRDSRKNNQMRGVAAIYLLGRMADDDPQTLQALSDIARTAAAVLPIVQIDHMRPPRYDTMDNPRFQFFMHSLTALLRIGRGRPALAPAVSAAVLQATQGDAYVQALTSEPPGTHIHHMVKAVGDWAGRQARAL